MDFNIINGDRAVFDPLFTPAIVTAPPCTITGTAKGKANGRVVCAAGDEPSVVVVGASTSRPRSRSPAPAP